MSVDPHDLPVSTTINGQSHQTSVVPGLLLVDFLRDTLGLTGTKVGCETGQCGMCVVLLDGVSVKSCAVLAAQADGSAITTVEGLAQGDQMAPLQESFAEYHAVQCGYCTPSLLISLTDLLSRNGQPEEAEIRSWMDGIMCRCGVFQHAVRAVQNVGVQAS
jgi:carbon-monoxide dehydrogenase small subunit